ncbi:MAG: hypothetical protein AMXMBFR84_38710 [Candidatus Hydrogenedentota bacterium]
MNTRRDRRGGWILLETLVALAVLSIGIIAVNRALGQALVSRALARDYTEASFHLQDVMGRLRLEPKIAVDTSGKGVCSDSDGRFHYTWSVDRVPFDPPPIMQTLPPHLGQINLPVRFLGRLRVTVTWTRQGRPYELTAETLVQPERIWTRETGTNAATPTP